VLQDMPLRGQPAVLYAPKSRGTRTAINPAYGRLQNFGNGTFIYTPDANFNGSDGFSYDICNQGNDDTSLCDSGTVNITVTPVNDSPIPTADGPYTVTEDLPLNIPAPGILGNDTDIDGDNLTATVVTTTAYGDLVMDSTGAFVYTPNSNYNGPDAFTYAVCDGTVCVEAEVTLDVTTINDPPVASDDTFSGDEDTNIIGSVQLNDMDVDSLALTAMQVTTPGHGSLTLDPNGDFAYTPTTDFSGLDAFTYELCDSDGACDNASVTLVINAVADTPSLITAPASGLEGTPFPLTITAASTDSDGSEKLDINVLGLPEGATLSAGSKSGTIWTLGPDDLPGMMLTVPNNGLYTLTVQVTAIEQDNSATNTVAASLPVTVTNVTPTVDSIDLSATTVRVGEDLTATISISDPGGEETLTATFDWGDGTTETITTTDSTVTIDGVHQYQVEGFYIIILTIDDGDSTTEATSELLTVYSPGDSFLTGGDSINVYREMCQLSTRCANKSGTANSGFSAQYPDASSDPEGTTQFTFSEGGLEFFADSYQWLIIVGGWAQYGGTGTINGIGQYAFVITAMDADVDTYFGIETDRFGIKIIDVIDNDKIVFDTALSPDASMDYFGTVPTIGGATVKIHKSG
jgi:VCBS repeat-containing protein